MRWIIVLAAMLAACGRDTAKPSSGISRETFITVYVELGRARDLSTPSEFEPKKEEILRRHGVTEAQLKAFVDAHGRQLDFMAEVWDSVRQRLTSRDTEAE